MNDNTRFNVFPSVFNTASAALTFARGFVEERVVVKIGRKFACVRPAFAKRMKLKVIKELT